jgi:hypothetical protein
MITIIWTPEKRDELRACYDEAVKSGHHSLLFDGLGKRSTEITSRLTEVAGDVRNLRSEHSVTRDLVTKLPATVLGAIEKPLLKRMTDLEDRTTKLEEGEEHS